ncbi:MAG: hypothetical protein RLZZ01_2387, partial [Actinomycetota bacterium]
MMKELLQRRAAGRVWERRRIARWSALGAVSMFVGGAFVAPSAVPMAVGTLRPMTADIVELQSWDAADGSMSLSDLTADLFAAGAGASDGSGVDVALIDTGVAPVDGLDGPGKVLHGPDLSFEGAHPNVAFLDTYGHGTHMAGIIAGDRAGDQGVAPGARIVSVKTAGHDGVTTVPQVIAAIDWVVDHHDQAGLNIRVLNLSLGQANICNYRGDYLSAAVERAWQAGIVVVVAAGNDGETQRCLNSPAIDPYVVAVGTADALSSPDAIAKRSVPAWSGVGDGKRNPDVVAPGRSIASYRVPGSTIDQLAPNAAIDEDSMVGTGTSQSAAVTAGVAARLIGANPGLSVDQVKATLLGYAVNLPHVDYVQDGSGHIDAGMSLVGRPWSMKQTYPSASSGGGKGGMTTPSGASWSGGSWSGASWSGASWSGGSWSGGSWSGAS